MQVHHNATCGHRPLSLYAPVTINNNFQVEAMHQVSVIHLLYFRPCGLDSKILFVVTGAYYESGSLIMTIPKVPFGSSIFIKFVACLTMTRGTYRGGPWHSSRKIRITTPWQPLNFKRAIKKKCLVSRVLSNYCVAQSQGCSAVPGVVIFSLIC